MTTKRILKIIGFATAVTVLMAAQTGVAQAQVVAIGASNTDGFGVSRSQAWPALLEGMLRAKGISATVSNQGITGEQTPATLARIDSIPAGTKVIIINPGSYNDTPASRAGSRSAIDPKQTEANIAAMVQKARSKATTVIMLRGGGSAYGAVNVPGSGVGAAGIQSDRIHYNPTGHATIAQRLLPSVERGLKGR